MNELVIRFGFFAGVFVAMAGWEIVASRRPLPGPRRERWPANLAIVLLDTLLLRLLLPAGAVGMAALGAQHGWGLFHAVAFPPALAFVVALVVLDLIIYLQHRLFHAVPALWRLHRVHHADVGFDVTTGTRFHPLEMILSMLVKVATVAALGASPSAVLSFEVLLNATSMFNHGNVRMPGLLDQWLRWIVVTPDMHRVHHSVLVRETNSNFGFNLPWWDRLFGTYRDQPAAGHDGMAIGLEAFRDARLQSLAWMLVLPFAARSDRRWYQEAA